MLLRLAVIPALLSLCACVSAATTSPAELPAGRWTLDQDHASVTWQVRHIGLSWYTARFDTARASLDFDPANPQDARLTAIVDASSISTGDPDFDETLRGGSWFGADQHPEIVFRSTSIEVTGPTSGRIMGDLTLKGVTRPAVLETEFYGGVFNPLEGRQALGFSAIMTIDRTQFGIGQLPGNFIGDTVRVSIEAEFLQERS